MSEPELSLCARCAESGATCCQNTQVFLTRGDIRRIGAAGEEDFYHYAAPGDPACLPDRVQDPVWFRTFGLDGRRRVIRHRPGGDCRFLSPGGCRLPLPARPLVCRLYPYDYNHIAIKGVHGHLCPLPEAESPHLLLAVLGMNREAAEGWRRELYREIAAEFPEPG